ncbi:glycosyltransferase [Sphingomonas aestuarii]
MRIVFVLTYPTHYATPDLSEWLAWDNRDRRMPALLKAMGVDVELWGVRDVSLDTGIAVADLGTLKVRLFAASNPDAPPRAQISDALVEAARKDSADLFVLIGSDGAAGLDLHARALAPGDRAYAVIIGGTVWNPILTDARLVLTESSRQEMLLMQPEWRFWRKPVPLERMARLPKTIDTDRFAPIADARKRWDAIAVSRLIPYKSFDEIGRLSQRHRVAVAGDGPMRLDLRRRWPRVEWLGHVAHTDLPATLAKARLFFHAGRKDWFPRAIPEAMACGLPVIAFDDRIDADVVPPSTGTLVNDQNYRSEVATLLGAPGTLAAKGRSARAHVAATHGPRSSEAACRKLIEIARAPRAPA